MNFLFVFYPAEDESSKNRGDTDDPDSPDPDSPVKHRLRRQRVKRGGNYSKDKTRAGYAASTGDRSHSQPDIMGMSPPTQDSDFQPEYVPSAYSQSQPQRKPVGIRHSLPISNPATSATRQRNVLPPTEEAEGATQSSTASGVSRSSSTKGGREPRFV